VDFTVDADVQPGAGLTGVDHIAHTMAYDEMLSWSLFYTSIFAADKSPMLDVVDPDGFVRSQAIRAGALRLTLNGGESRRTLAGRFIEDTFGSSVQHLGFRSYDFFASAPAMQDRGFPVLKIGANYYDDVEARFGLDPALRRRMQTLNIMYDEEPGGQFFQFYSEAQPSSR
jgi:4-hydroxyphenylpyruvate dioxygenase